MSRRSKGARLYYRGQETDDQGRIRKRGVWIIRDGTKRISTGCALEDRERAEQMLAEYIAAKYQPGREQGRHPSQVLIADVCNIYASEWVAGRHAEPKETGQRLLMVASYPGWTTLGDVHGRSCRGYVEWRRGQVLKTTKPEKTGTPARTVTVATARRELEDLRAAINYHHKQRLCSEVVAVTLPERPPPREDWFLTREQAARLLWAAWRSKQTMRGGEATRDVGRHTAHFILAGLYTGTRSGAICSAAFVPAIGRGHVDLDAGVFHRRPQGARATKKRQPPVRLPDRLLVHLRRWHRHALAKNAVVEWNGKAITSIRRSFITAVEDSGINAEFLAKGLPRVTPHILRHTAATWLMKNGADLWQAAGFLGMTPEVLWRVYGHHHPDFQKDVAAKLGGRIGGRMTGNKTGQQRAS